MNRIQKKCFIASTGLHLSLALVLLVGPAFFSPKSQQQNVPLIDFVPVKVIDAALAGGGNPNANPLPPPPAPPQPAPPSSTPAAVVEVREPPKPVKEQTNLKPDPEPSLRSERSKPQISLKPVYRRSGQTSSSKSAANAKADDSRREIADRFGAAITGLRNNLKPTTGTELRGPGGGGETYAGFAQNILSTYDRAWISPDGMDNSDAVVGVEVTIEPDGRVSSARIVDPSGDPRVDRSVREALERVKSVPVPDGMKTRRTVEFNFHSRLKQTI